MCLNKSVELQAKTQVLLDKRFKQDNEKNVFIIIANPGDSERISSVERNYCIRNNSEKEAEIMHALEGKSWRRERKGCLVRN